MFVFKTPKLIIIRTRKDGKLSDLLRFWSLFVHVTPPVTRLPMFTVYRNSRQSVFVRLCLFKIVFRLLLCFSCFMFPALIFQFGLYEGSFDQPMICECSKQSGRFEKCHLATEQMLPTLLKVNVIECRITPQFLPSNRFFIEEYRKWASYGRSEPFRKTSFYSGRVTFNQTCSKNKNSPFEENFKKSSKMIPIPKNIPTF